MTWPGVAMTPTSTQLNGFDVYSYTGTFDNCIFNNGNGAQTADLTPQDGMYFAGNKWCTLDELQGGMPTVEHDTVYCLNTNGWSAVNCYMWSPANATWPGEPMLKEGTVGYDGSNGGAFDLYRYVYVPGPANVIFNDGNGTQTDDLTLQAGKVYVPALNAWKNLNELSFMEEPGEPIVPDGSARYYYKGFIDDADYEPTDASLFVGGMASISFTTNAYLFVIYQEDGKEGVQYMTSEWVSGPTHATLSVNGNGGYNKWACPKGTTKVYLYDNGDGTLEISSEPMPGKTLVNGGTALEKVQSPDSSVKFIKNGQLFIRKNGVTYNCLGSIVAE